MFSQQFTLLKSQLVSSFVSANVIYNVLKLCKYCIYEALKDSPVFDVLYLLCSRLRRSQTSKEQLNTTLKIKSRTISGFSSSALSMEFLRQFARM